ncbi:hypothetical protein J4439_07580 [Candidatus Woesearchaeota archaeon]|nr:hypothetical protein [Candidatus Woesearchaeota archaeon]
MELRRVLPLLLALGAAALVLTGSAATAMQFLTGGWSAVKSALPAYTLLIVGGTVLLLMMGAYFRVRESQVRMRSQVVITFMKLLFVGALIAVVAAAVFFYLRLRP